MSCGAAEQFIKGDSGGVGDIEALHLSGCGQAGKQITMLSCQAAEARSFGAKHQCDAGRELKVGQGSFAIAVEADHLEAQLLQFVNGANEVGDAGNTNLLEAARCGLGQRAAKRRTVAIGRNEGGGAEYGCGPENRPEIVWIGDLIEHDDMLGILADLGDVAVGQGGGSQRNALMDRARREQSGDLIITHNFWRDGKVFAQVGALPRQFGFGGSGQAQAFGCACGIAQGSQNCMKTI